MNKKYPLWYQFGAEFIKNIKYATIFVFMVVIIIMLLIGIMNLFATGHLILGIISAAAFIICFISCVATLGRFC